MNKTELQQELNKTEIRMAILQARLPQNCVDVLDYIRANILQPTATHIESPDMYELAQLDVYIRALRAH